LQETLLDFDIVDASRGRRCGALSGSRATKKNRQCLASPTGSWYCIFQKRPTRPRSVLKEKTEALGTTR